MTGVRPGVERVRFDWGANDGGGASREDILEVTTTTIHSMGDFKKLIAWQKAHAYALAVHAAYKGTNTRAAPGMRGQILRAVNSISATLAEGCAKRSRADLARFADMAYASAKEVENHLITSRDLGILSSNLTADLLRQGDEVSRLCFALARPARDSTATQSRPV